MHPTVDSGRNTHFMPESEQKLWVCRTRELDIYLAPGA